MLICNNNNYKRNQEIYINVVLIFLISSFMIKSQIVYQHHIEHR